MLIVRPDFARRIDLPGAGPCPRPIDLDRHRAPLRNLVSLRVYSFARGIAIEGEAEGDEVFIALMRGAADFAIDRDSDASAIFALREDGRRALYMPPHACYRLHATEDCAIAYARCVPARADLPAAHAIAADGGITRGTASGMTLALARLDAGQAISAGDRNAAAERFVHVRASGDAALRLGGERLGDWDAAIIAEGETATIAAEGGAIDLLVVSAAA
jgi:hypothetical protein